MSAQLPVKPACVAAAPGAPGDSVVHAALAGMARLQQMIAIYPGNHPAIRTVLETTVKAISDAIERAGDLTVCFGTDHLTIGDQKHPTPGAIGDWMRQLRNLDIAAISFAPPITTDALAATCRILSRADKNGLRGSALAQAVEAECSTVIVLKPVDFGQLSFQNTASARRLDKAVVWDYLVSGKAVDDRRKLESLITTAASRYQGEGASATASLRAELKALLTVHCSDGSPAERELLAELGRACAALSPELRSELLSVVSETAAHPEEAFLEIARHISTAETLDVLKRLRSKPSESLIRVLKALSLAAHAQGQILARPDVANVSDKPDTSEQLEVLFASESESEFIPEDYLAVLEQASRTAGDKPLLKTWPYRNPENGRERTVQSCEIAIFLLQSDEPHVDCADPALALLHESLGELLQGSRLDLIIAVYESCRSRFSTNRLAEQILAKIESKQGMDAVIALVAASQIPVEDACRLFVHFGTRALKVLASHAELNEPLRDLISQLLTEIEPELALEALCDLGEMQICRIPSILKVVEAATPTRGLAILRAFCRHPDQELRRRAYSLINAMFAVWPSDLARSGLIDSDPLVRELVEKQIQTWNEPDRHALFSALAESEEPAARNIAWSALAQLGEPGLHWLCAKLDRLIHAPGSTSVARELALFLGAFRANLTVRRTLRRWRWSPLRLVATLRIQAA